MLKGLLLFIFYLGGISAGQAGVAQFSRLLCLRLLSQNDRRVVEQSPPLILRVDESHFPHSKIGMGKGYAPTPYAHWAVAEVQAQAKNFGILNPEIILDDIRRSYVKFGHKQKRDTRHIRFRVDDTGFYVLSHIGILIKDGSSPEVGEAGQIAHYPLIVNNVEHSLGGFSLQAKYLRYAWQYAPNTFADPHGRTLLTAAIMQHSSSPVLNTIIFRSAGAWETKPTFQHIMQRVSQLGTLKWNATTRAEWLRLMRGYFLTMPFYVGTAGIGRVFFTALATKMRHGQALTLPGDIDIYALTLSEKDFVKWGSMLLEPSTD